MREKLTTRKIIFTALMTALVYVATMIAFPLLGSKVRLANPVSLLGSLLMGPLLGGLASGLGSLIYDIQTGYGLESIITFVSKFIMAWVCGRIAFAGERHDKWNIEAHVEDECHAEDHKWNFVAKVECTRNEKNHTRNVLACTVGAWTYVVLYMLKTFIFQRFVYGFPGDAVWATMLSKLPASAINAVAAMVIAPIFYAAIRPALKAAGLLDELRP